MTTLYGDTGRVSTGTLKTINFNYFPTENDSMALTLPLAKPSTPQFSYTLNSNAFSIDVNITSYVNEVYLALSGKNTTGVTATVYMEVWRNGSLYSGTQSNRAITNNYYYTCGFGKSDPLFTVGDVFDFYAWASVDGVSLIHSMGMVVPDRIDFGINPNKGLMNFTLVTSQPHLILRGVTGYSKGGAWTGGLYTLPAAPTTSLFSIGSNITAPFITLNKHITNGQMYSQGSNANSIIGINSSASFLPFIQQSICPTSISYREINL